MTRMLWMLGIVVVGLAVVSARSDGAVVVRREQIEISAPILPAVLKLYTTFPATLDGERAMAHDAALTYERLLAECAADYPAITPPPADGTWLTPDQLSANYVAVADCSYQKYTAKPYWIPKLIADVDICGTELGAGWRLITEADLATLTESDFQFASDTLTPVTAQSTSGLGPLYFGLLIWVRGNDGVLKLGTLAPGVPGPRVSPVPGLSDPNSTAFAYQSLPGPGLRCIRRTDLP